MLSVFLLFCPLFFFKQKTAYEMRISDWSSDVCSSDLQDRVFGNGAIGECDHPRGRGAKAHLAVDLRGVETGRPALDDEAAAFAVELGPDAREIGDRGGGDPRLAAVEDESAREAFGARQPRAGVGTAGGFSGDAASDRKRVGQGTSGGASVDIGG